MNLNTRIDKRTVIHEVYLMGYSCSRTLPQTPRIFPSLAPQPAALSAASSPPWSAFLFLFGIVFYACFGLFLIFVVFLFSLHLSEDYLHFFPPQLQSGNLIGLRVPDRLAEINNDIFPGCFRGTGWQGAAADPPITQAFIGLLRAAAHDVVPIKSLANPIQTDTFVFMRTADTEPCFRPLSREGPRRYKASCYLWFMNHYTNIYIYVDWYMHMYNTYGTCYYTA